MEMMKMLGAMGGGGGDNKGEMAEAQRLWKMLDDLAESDPQAYGKFLSKQMKGAKEAAPKAETRPAFCLQCKPKKAGPSCSAVFINVTHCKEVAEAYVDKAAGISVPGRDEEDSEDEDDLRGMRIPIARTGEPRKDMDSLVCEVAVNSLAVLRSAKEPAFREMLERTVLAAAAQFFQIDFSPHYFRTQEKFHGDKTAPVLVSSVEGKGKGRKGDGQEGGKEDQERKKQLIQEVKPGAAAAGKQGKGGGRSGKKEADGSSRAAGAGDEGKEGGRQMATMDSPDGLLRSLRGEREAKEPEGELELPPSGSKTVASNKKPLIEEIVACPKHSLEETETDLVLTVEMPLALGVGEMDLLVSQRSVAISSSQYKLNLDLDKSVDSDQVSAKFHKKKKALVLKMRKG